MVTPSVASMSPSFLEHRKSCGLWGTGEHVDSPPMAARAYQFASSSMSASRDATWGGLDLDEGPGVPAYDMLLYDDSSPPSLSLSDPLLPFFTFLF